MQFKYIKSYCTGITEEFFDLVHDSLENNNLIDHPSYINQVQLYRAKLTNLRSETGDIETLALTSCNLVDTLLKTTLPENLETSSFKVSPNPASEYFNIRYVGNESRTIEVSIMDVLGKQVFMRLLDLQKGSTLNIDCSNWPGGFYTVSFKDLLGERQQKIIVTR
jgi:hypothetical protein